MLASTRVRCRLTKPCFPSLFANHALSGIGPKVTQSVLTAAFLFAFKDVLYEQTVKLRMGRKVAAK